MMKATIVLYDIDGTLLTSGGAGRRAMEHAFAAHTGRRDACAHFSFAGMTDRAIARVGLCEIGWEATEAAIDALIAHYLACLEREVREARDYRLCEGIVASLDFLRGRSGYAIGLGTGNVEAGARIKLSRVGEAERFALGGFGSDAEDRAALLAVGAERGAKRLGTEVARCRVVVIGDTPKDIDAARAIGAVAIGVGTGPFTAEDLAAHGAHHAFRDLAQPGALQAIVADAAADAADIAEVANGGAAAKISAT